LGGPGKTLGKNWPFSKGGVGKENGPKKPGLGQRSGKGADAKGEGRITQTPNNREEKRDISALNHSKRERRGEPR